MANFKPNYFQKRTKPHGPRANERIRSRDVQVIGSNGGNLGILPLNKAIFLAKEDSSYITGNTIHINGGLAMV